MPDITNHLSHKRTLSLCIVILLNKQRKNDLEVAHPHCGSPTTIPGWIGVWKSNIGFWGKGKARVLKEKHLAAEERTNNKLNPHIYMYGVNVTNWTHATLVEGECSHHWDIPCFPANISSFETFPYDVWPYVEPLTSVHISSDHLYEARWSWKHYHQLLMPWTGFAIFWAC